MLNARSFPFFSGRPDRRDLVPGRDERAVHREVLLEVIQRSSRIVFRQHDITVTIIGVRGIRVLFQVELLDGRSILRAPAPHGFISEHIQFDLLRTEVVGPLRSDFPIERNGGIGTLLVSPVGELLWWEEAVERGVQFDGIELRV